MLWTEGMVDELVRCMVQGTATDQPTHPHSHTHKLMDGEMGNPKNSVSSLLLLFSLFPLFLLFPLFPLFPLFSLFPFFSLFAFLASLLMLTWS